MAITRRLKSESEREPNLMAGFEASINLDTLKQERFYHPGDVTIVGDANVSGVMIVGGSLKVVGHLKVGKLYCYGDVHVGGSLNAKQCTVGNLISVERNIKADRVLVGFDIDDMANEHRGETVMVGVVEIEFDFVLPDVADRITEEREWAGIGPSLFSMGNVKVKYLNVERGIEVKGCLAGVTIESSQTVKAGSLSVSKQLLVFSDVECDGDLNCLDLSCTGLKCLGDATARNIETFEDDLSVLGKIFCGQNLMSKGSIQAGKSIFAGSIAAENYVKVGTYVNCLRILTGPDYGIFAGLCVPRSLWEKEGFVNSTELPQNVLSGAIVESRE